MAKKQVKIYLETPFIQELSEAAVRYGRRSENALMEELIAKFFPIWKKVEEEKLQLVNSEYEQEVIQKRPLRKVK